MRADGGVCRPAKVVVNRPPEYRECQVGVAENAWMGVRGRMAAAVIRTCSAPPVSPSHSLMITSPMPKYTPVVCGAIERRLLSPLCRSNRSRPSRKEPECGLPGGFSLARPVSTPSPANLRIRHWVNRLRRLRRFHAPLYASRGKRSIGLLGLRANQASVTANDRREPQETT